MADPVKGSGNKVELTTSCTQETFGSAIWSENNTNKIPEESCNQLINNWQINIVPQHLDNFSCSVQRTDVSRNSFFGTEWTAKCVGDLKKVEQGK